MDTIIFFVAFSNGVALIIYKHAHGRSNLLIYIKKALKGSLKEIRLSERACCKNAASSAGAKGSENSPFNPWDSTHPALLAFAFLTYEFISEN